MYKNFNETYHFIDKFKEDDLLKLNPKVSLIYRNYINPIDINLIKKIRLFCKKWFSCFKKITSFRTYFSK